jgi:hypothetical protein
MNVRTCAYVLRFPGEIQDLYVSWPGNHLVLLVPEAYLTHRIQNTEYRIQNTAAVELKYTKLPIPVFTCIWCLDLMILKGGKSISRAIGRGGP